MRALCFAAALAGACLLSGGPAAVAQTAAERCEAAIRALDAYTAGSDRVAIEADATALIKAYGCDPDAKHAALRAASRRLTELALAGSTAGASGDETLARLTAARRISQTWQTLVALADLLTAAHDFATATQAYQAALNDMAEPQGGEPPVPADRRAWAYQRANETQMLAPDEQAPRTRAGTPGGLDQIFDRQSADRGIRLWPRYLPVTFQSDSADITPQGRVVAERWVEAIRSSGVTSILVVGHADPRGTDARNDELSARRATTLAMFLRANGFAGQIVAAGMGRRCPVEFSSADGYTQDQQFQIMRRVEVMPGARLPAEYCHGQVAVTAH
jgi:outer membrane protein OmpA-like peptidoglycan-associated protein